MAEPDVDRRRDALIQAGLTLASELSLPSVLQKIVDLACEVADARYGALAVLGPDAKHIRDFLTHGLTDQERDAIGTLPEGRGILGLIIEESRPLRLANIRDHPQAAGFPPNHPAMTTFLGVPIEVRGRVFGNLYLAEKRGGSEFTEEDQQAVMTLAAQAAVAVENARLYEDARLRRRRLEAANEVTQAILEGRDTDEVLRLIAVHAREMIGAALATVVTPAPAPGLLVVRVAVGERADALQGMRFPADDSISGEVIRSRQPLLIADVAKDERASQPVVRVGGIGPAVFVPLAVGGRAFGTLLVANLVGGARFSDDDLTVVRLFASQAAVALEYARFREELQRLAILEDRERIAKELHDGVIQSLFALGMSLQSAEDLAEETETVRARLSSSIDAIDGIIRDLRNYIFGLRPGAVADLHLDRTIHEMTEGFAEGAPLAVEAHVDRETAALLAGRATDVIQAAREILSNAVRHSEGTKVALTLGRDGSEAVLEVRDDGRGFDPATSEGKGQGLANLRSRARALAGRLEIDSGGSGTTVRLHIPL